MQDDTLSKRVRAVREAAGMTQQTLATRAGISLRTLSRIEAGEDSTLGTIDAIANALGTTVAGLFETEAAS